MKKIISALVIVFALFAITNAQETKKEAPKQNTYFVSVPHTAEGCLAAMDELKASKAGLLSKMYEGCMHGDHTSYGFLTGASEADVRAMIPTSQQKTAKLVPVDQFTAAQIESFHKK